MKTIIHVDQHAIRRNIHAETPEPVFTVKTYKDNRRAFTVHIDGPSKFVYRPQNPLSCGARVWVEADSEHIRLDEGLIHAELPSTSHPEIC